MTGKKKNPRSGSLSWLCRFGRSDVAEENPEGLKSVGAERNMVFIGVYYATSKVRKTKN